MIWKPCLKVYNTSMKSNHPFHFFFFFIQNTGKLNSTTRKIYSLEGKQWTHQCNCTKGEETEQSHGDYFDCEWTIFFDSISLTLWTMPSMFLDKWLEWSSMSLKTMSSCSWKAAHRFLSRCNSAVNSRIFMSFSSWKSNPRRKFIKY